MGRITVLLITCWFLSANVFAAPSPSSGGSPRRIKLEKSYESRDAYEADKHRGKGWIEVRDNALVFRGSKGEVKKEMSVDLRGDSRPESSRAKATRDNEKVLIERIRYIEPEGSISRREVYSADGSSVKIDWEQAGEVWPSPDGEYFVGFGHVGYNSDGKLRFFGPDGQISKEVKAFDWGARQARIVFSDDGEIGAFLQAGEKFSVEAGRAKSADEFGGIAVFDRQGNILGKLERAQWQVVGPGDGKGRPHVRVLPGSRKVILIRGDADSTIDCVDFTGNLVWSRPARPVKGAACKVNMAISADSRDAALFVPCPEKSHLKILKVESGGSEYSGEVEIAGGQLNLPWKPVPERERAHFDFLRVDEKFILVYSRAKRGKGSQGTHGLLVFDGKGRQVEEMELSEPVDEAVRDNDDFIAVKQGNRVVKWRLERESR